MTNKKILDLNKALRALKLPGAKFAYAVARNINILEPYVKALQEALKQDENYLKFEKERVELVKSHSKKDEKGKMVMLNQEQVEIEDQEAFEKAIETLKEAHKETLDARDTQLKDFDTLLTQEVTIELHKVKQEDLPTQITTEQLTSIFDIVE